MRPISHFSVTSSPLLATSSLLQVQYRPPRQSRLGGGCLGRCSRRRGDPQAQRISDEEGEGSADVLTGELDVGVVPVYEDGDVLIGETRRCSTASAPRR